MCFFGEIKLNSGELLNCEFDGNICEVKSLVIDNNGKIITGFIGQHQDDRNVNGIKIKNALATFIPAQIGLLFNLTIFEMYFKSLLEIKSKDFEGMDNLKDLNLGLNRLKTLPADVCLLEILFLTV